MSYIREVVEIICAESKSYAEVLRKLGRRGGGSQRILKKKIEEWDIDISHFTGQGWNKGLKMSDYEQTQSRAKYTNDEVFCENSPVSQKMLRGYVRRSGFIKYECAFCGCTGEWQGGVISLELDHVDGKPDNNRIENLRYLCPNCHALTETFRGRNISKMKSLR